MRLFARWGGGGVLGWVSSSEYLGKNKKYRYSCRYCYYYYYYHTYFIRKLYKSLLENNVTIFCGYVLAVLGTVATL